MKKRMAAALTLLAGLGAGTAAVVAGGAASTTAAAAPAPAIGPSEAREVALVRAAAAGDAQPAVAVESDSTAEAETSMAAPQGALLDEGEGNVYLVTMRGSFTLGQAHLPRGAKAPTGSVMKVAIDRNGLVVGIHLGDR
jgi:hypothetical protein